MATPKINTLSETATKQLLEILQKRFEKHPERHQGITWADVAAQLKAKPQKLFVLEQMEETGGEPDVVILPENANAFVFFDCAAESPKGRRSLCFDREAWEARKEARPENTVMDMAADLGITLLTEEQYRHLQTLGSFDTKTSSWIQTPTEIRKLGGALFGDRRYNQVFTYHNGAQSYYAARGFRGMLEIE